MGVILPVHVQRHAQAAFGEAWDRATALVPEGWRPIELTPLQTAGGYPPVWGEYDAMTLSREWWLGETDDDDHHVSAQGPTPTAALIALADALEARAAR